MVAAVAKGAASAPAPIVPAKVRRLILLMNIPPKWHRFQPVKLVQLSLIKRRKFASTLTHTDFA